MRLIQINIRGYRSLRDIEWNPGSLNVLIGPNAAGKSNLLDALETLSISARGDLGAHVLKDHGGMTSLVFDGQADGVSIVAKTSPVDGGLSHDAGSLTYELTLERLGTSSAYRIGHELLGNYRRVEEGSANQPFKYLERSARHAVVFDENEKGLQSQGEPTYEEETLLSESGGVLNPNRTVKDFRHELVSWITCQGLQVGDKTPMRRPAVTRHETRMNPDGGNLVSVLHTLYSSDRVFREDLRSAMTAAFGSVFEEIIFAPDADQRIQLQVQWKNLGRARPAADLSDGTLRFLYLIAILANPNPPSLISIDEPEIGLHPSMLPIVAEFAADAATRSQVIMATHSTDLLNALSEHMPVTTILSLKNGESVLKTLHGEKLEYWVKTYRSLGEFHRSGAAESLT